MWMVLLFSNSVMSPMSDQKSAPWLKPWMRMMGGWLLVILAGVAFVMSFGLMHMTPPTMSPVRAMMEISVFMTLIIGMEW